jgi:hypothetical protein
MFGYSARPWSFGSSQVDPANDFSLSQALPFPGKLALRGERALAEADAAGSGVDAERVQLAAFASRLFDEYWLAERALETNAQHLELLDETHAVALSRYSAGKGSQQDVLAAETEQAMLSHREIELGAERRILAERINTLLHRAPQLELPASPHELELEPESAPELDEPALVARALENRPELRARRAEVRVDHVFRQPGPHVVAVTLTPPKNAKDALASDDRRDLVVDVNILGALGRRQPYSRRQTPARVSRADCDRSKTASASKSRARSNGFASRSICSTSRGRGSCLRLVTVWPGRRQPLRAAR